VSQLESVSTKPSDAEKRWDKNLQWDDAVRVVSENLAKARLAAQDLDDPFAPKKLLSWDAILIGLSNASRVGETYDALVEWCTTGKSPVMVRVEKLRQPCSRRGCKHQKTPFRNNPNSGHEIIGKGLRGRCRVFNCSCQRYLYNPDLDEKKEMNIPDSIQDDRKYFGGIRFARERHRMKRGQVVIPGKEAKAKSLFGYRERGAYTLWALKCFMKRNFVVNGVHCNPHSTRYCSISYRIKQGQSLPAIAKEIHMKTLNLLIEYQTEQEGLEANRAIAEKL
jgi:hypothetical protein